MTKTPDDIIKHHSLFINGSGCWALMQKLSMSETTTTTTNTTVDLLLDSMAKKDELILKCLEANRNLVEDFTRTSDRRFDTLLNLIVDLSERLLGDRRLGDKAKTDVKVIDFNDAMNSVINSVRRRMDDANRRDDDVVIMK